MNQVPHRTTGPVQVSAVVVASPAVLKYPAPQAETTELEAEVQVRVAPVAEFVTAVHAVKANKSRVRQGMIQAHTEPTLWQHVRARLMMADALHTVYAGRRTQDS